MKIAKIRLLKEPDKSFIVYKETNQFSQWHHHPEYELVLITKGHGKRMVGDNINRFEENDLVFIGPYTPHEWLCDPEYFTSSGGFKGEGLVVQFLYNFIGESFFEIPENSTLKKFLNGASRGYEFYGNSRRRIASLMLKMIRMNDFDRLQSLFSIFRMFVSTKEYYILSSPSFMESNYPDENEPMQKALKYLLRNFHKKVLIKDLLEITNMSGSSFCTAFKNTYRMTFKDYLLSIRIGYACKLLTDSSQNISRAAYDSGFENISNFNRQFKKIKHITPSQFIKEVNSIEHLEFVRT